MKAIGGYFELELKRGGHYHRGAILLNTARNCFEYILRANHYTKVYIPYYTCEVLLEPLRKCHVAYEFYRINEFLEPVVDITLSAGEALLYTNYFGLKQSAVERLAAKYGLNLIVDNAQAFFAPPINGIDTFYSARKFFGVPDGAYLYTNTVLNEEIECDFSYARMSHLLKRLDCSAECGYVDFQRNDASLCDSDMKRMSALTESLLCSIDYEVAKKKRIENYEYLHAQLTSRNLLFLARGRDDIPMVYPYLLDYEIKQQLIDHKIFVATYWNNVFDWCTPNQWEYQLATNMVSLPLDQRYGEKEMKLIIEKIKENGI